MLLDMVLLDKYGPQWLTWEPETIWDEIADDFKQTVSIHDASKIQAMKTLHVVETPWKAWEAFVPVCQAINNNIPDFRSLYKPTLAQASYAVRIMNLVNPDEQFSEEVSKFIAACFLDDDVVYLPPPVDFAQDEAMMLQYRCTKCDRIDVDEDNMMCDHCGAPQSALVKEPTWDPKPVKERYDQVVKQGDDHDVLQEIGVDIQVAKLLVVSNYIDYRMGQFKTQAEAVINGKRPV
jgi:ribosomal protein L37E